MKTIEERIQEYVANAWVELDQFNEDHVTFENIVTSACVVGANFEYEELTRWRDPKEELPQNGQLVLCKTSDKKLPFVTVKYGRSEWWIYVYPGWAGIGHKIIGWRPIHENE